jgi:hypothetical protein
MTKALFDPRGPNEHASPQPLKSFATKGGLVTIRVAPQTYFGYLVSAYRLGCCRVSIA